MGITARSPAILRQEGNLLLIKGSNGSQEFSAEGEFAPRRERIAMSPSA